MLPMLRLLAITALKGQMNQKETQTFALLACAALFGSLKVLRSSGNGVRGLIKSLSLVLLAHSLRGCAHKGLALLFPNTFQALGLPVEPTEDAAEEVVDSQGACHQILCFATASPGYCTHEDVSCQCIHSIPVPFHWNTACTIETSRGSMCVCSVQANPCSIPSAYAYCSRALSLQFD